MKKTYFLSLIIFILPSLTYAQSIDKSIYQETRLTDAYENVQYISERVLYFKSTVHFEEISVNSDRTLNAVFSQNGSLINLRYSLNLPRINRFQLVNIYYRFVLEQGNFRIILDLIEFINGHYFIIGDRYRTLDNLHLRTAGSLSGNVILTVQRRERVIVLQEGNVQTIDGITSAWVKVRLASGREGWCFGGYLGYPNRR
jgi:uncharacterized protein YgiM (DUF1202 family)